MNPLFPGINNRDDAIQWLYDRIDYERIRPASSNPFRLERIERLLKRIGSPHERIPAVHIAGTKGKGSTAAMVDSILRASGIHTGLFTSPHIEQFEERMRVSGRLPHPDQLTRLVSRLAEILHQSEVETADRIPTFFEITTLLAWMLFDEEDVDIAVLETGLGGRLDCTNVCRPLVTVITSIGLDHTHILGDTLSLIAAEKAGILKPGVPVVQGQLPEVADIVVTARARELGCRQLVCGREFAWQIDQMDDQLGVHKRSQRMLVRTPTNRYDGLTIPLLGQHQAHNASLAVMTAELLAEAGVGQIDAGSISQGLRTTHWPLRFEVFDQCPTIVLDAAHNPDSMRAVASVLTDSEWLNRRRVLVFAVSADKDAQSMAEIILPHFDDVILTRFLGNPRSRPPEDLLAISQTLTEAIPNTWRTQTAPDPQMAMQKARELAGAEGVVVVTGSIFLASEVRSLLTGNPEASSEK
ncbi:MAG TPA: folylpolyglutamate synthase/dihydrofolate synthase family protein [Planctomycetaceae bacterium]|nr:folylpolyglutamate synthase/dihydrofolate synthase family protein [Planctomycetaceae bacterium]